MYKLIKEICNNEYLICLLLMKWSKKYIYYVQNLKNISMLIKCLKMNLSISILNINYFNIANISRKTFRPCFHKTTQVSQKHVFEIHRIKNNHIQ